MGHNHWGTRALTKGIRAMNFLLCPLWNTCIRHYTYFWNMRLNGLLVVLFFLGKVHHTKGILNKALRQWPGGMGAIVCAAPQTIRQYTFFLNMHGNGLIFLFCHNLLTNVHLKKGFVKFYWNILKGHQDNDWLGYVGNFLICPHEVSNLEVLKRAWTSFTVWIAPPPLV